MYAAVTNLGHWSCCFFSFHSNREKRGKERDCITLITMVVAGYLASSATTPTAASTGWCRALSSPGLASLTGGILHHGTPLHTNTHTVWVWLILLQWHVYLALTVTLKCMILVVTIIILLLCVCMCEW